MDDETVKPGGRYYEQAPPLGSDGGFWSTLGFERVLWEPGHCILRWRATPEYSFPTASGHTIHGGLLTTILDSSMGNACWTTLELTESLVTLDLRVEFMRSAKPGILESEARVISRTRRVAFCGAQLRDESGRKLANARCTELVVPATR